MIALFVLLIIFFLLGEIFTTVFKLTKFKHKAIYGFMVYFSMFFILSGPLVFLHVPWETYSLIMNSFHIILVSFIIFYFISKKLWRKWSVSAVKAYFKDSWFVVLMIIIFLLLFLMSKGTLFFSSDFYASTAMFDDFIYISKAAKLIGSNSIFELNIDSVNGNFSPSIYMYLISYLELFWAYLSTTFNLDLLVAVRAVYGAIVYFIVFLAIDELFFLWMSAKHYKYGKFIIFGIVLLYLIHGMQSELSKFLFLPWFGNVFTAFILMPIILIILYQSLQKESMLYFFFIMIFVSCGFSAVSITFIAMLLPFCLGVWYKFKKYDLKYEKIVLSLFIIVELVFVLAATSSTIFSYKDDLLSIFKYTDATELYGEISYFNTSLREKFFLVFSSFVLYIWSFYNKKTSVTEKIFIGYCFFMVIISITPYISNMLFNLFFFPFRRFMEIMLLVLVLYSVYKIIEIIHTFKIRQILFIALVFTLLFNKTTGFFLLQQKNFFSVKNITNFSRTLPITDEVSVYFQEKEEINSVCILPSYTSVRTKWNDNYYIDFATAIVKTSNTYLQNNCSETDIGESVDYIITSSEYQFSIPELIESFELEKIIESTDVDIYIYKKL